MESPSAIARAGGCGVCDDDSDSAPTLIPDADGDVLSGRTTGIDLPQSIQTVPAESTESRARKIRVTQEDLRK